MLSGCYLRTAQCRRDTFGNLQHIVDRVRVLFAGNSLHRFEKKKGAQRDYSRDEGETDEMMQPLKELDMMMTQLANVSVLIIMQQKVTGTIVIF